MINDKQIGIKGAAQTIKEVIKILQEDKMIVTYDISCFERELKIVFPIIYKYAKNQIEDILDKAYCKWHSVEEIEDSEEKAYVEDSCCEEFMIEQLSMYFDAWERWTSEYYGSDPEEMQEEVFWTENRKEE